MCRLMCNEEILVKSFNFIGCEVSTLILQKTSWGSDI